MGVVICKNCGNETEGPPVSIICTVCETPHGVVIKSSDVIQDKKLIKYKKCPKCNHQNDTWKSNCSKCKTHLDKIYQICEKCGNEFSGDLCNCTKDVDRHIKQDDAGNSNVFKNHFESEKRSNTMSQSSSPRIYCQEDPHFVTDIKDGDVIGREGKIDVTPLPRSIRISRKHATFLFKNGQWFLRAEATTNSTKIGLRVIAEGEEVPLKDNDRIVLADIIFIFRST
jgi:hypothetical protein